MKNQIMILMIFVATNIFAYTNCNDPVEKINTYILLIEGLEYSDTFTGNPTAIELYYDFFRRMGFDDDHILLLADSTGRSKNSSYQNWISNETPCYDSGNYRQSGWIDDIVLCRADVLSALHWLNVNSDQNDNVIIISFTHGGQKPDGDGYDSDTEDDGYDGFITVGPDTWYDRLADGVFAQRLDSLVCNRLFLRMSACNSGEFYDDVWKVVDTTRTRVVFNSQPDQMVWLSQEFQNGQLVWNRGSVSEIVPILMTRPNSNYHGINGQYKYIHPPYNTPDSYSWTNYFYPTQRFENPRIGEIWGDDALYECWKYDLARVTLNSNDKWNIIPWPGIDSQADSVYHEYTNSDTTFKFYFSDKVQYGQINSNTIWDADTVFVVGDIYVPSGKTLTVKNGTVVRFTGDNFHTNANGLSSSKPEIIVAGTLNADTCSFVASSANTYNIAFKSTASAGRLRKCTISNAQYAVHINGASPTVEDCTISGGEYGIYITGSGAYPTVEKCDVTGTEYALYATNSTDPDIINSKFVSPSKYPAYFAGSADGYVYRCSFNISGTPTNKNLFYTTGSGTSPEIGYGMTDFGCLFDMGQTSANRAVYVAGGSPKLGNPSYNEGQYNDFLNRAASDTLVYNLTGSTIKAENNYWGGTPQSSWFFGSVDFTPYLNESQSAGPTWKRAADPLADAIVAYRNHNYQDAKELANQAIANKGDSQESAEALFYYAKAAFRLGTLKNDLSYIESYLTARDPELAHQARNWVSFANAQQGDLKKAEEITFQSPKGSLAERELMLQLISYYASYAMQTDVERLEKEFLSREFPGDVKDDLTIAKNNANLGMFGGEALPKEAPEINASEETSLAAYPNPFNAMTRIAYKLSEAKRVSIAVYNILGQRVRTLVDKELQAGRHEVIWNGLDEYGRAAASGVYLCQMITGAQRQTVKLILAK